MIDKNTLKRIVGDDLSDFWYTLSADDKRIITENFKYKSYKKNEIIYSETEKPINLYCLLEGKVKLFKNGIGDRNQILRLYRPVQYFGYRAYFANEPYVSSAAAFEASVVGYIPMKIVEDIIKKNNELAMFFIHELSKNLGGSDTKIVSLTQKHIRGRLAEALLMLVDKYGYENDDATIKIYMSREDLANLSNMTTSNAIRTLMNFVNEKLILVDGRRIKVINESELRKISKFG
ncbi:MAG: Crp/Fnr family transcriptional regulator [Roseburia sp.]|nr:Crp/Fnr family transcriptional regulator [Roseburia sp.]